VKPSKAAQALAARVAGEGKYSKRMAGDNSQPFYGIRAGTAGV
jgi:hypothetical protein